VFSAGDFQYYDLQRRQRSGEIGLCFPDWQPGDERLAVLCPHDDDGILGAGYAILAAQANGASVYPCIFCDGRAGYSDVAAKSTIVPRRRQETVAAYGALEVPRENIIRFDYPDFSLDQWVGWFLPGGQTGTMAQIVPTLRRLEITRVLIPNGYREHIDHEATHRIGSYNTPQVGDPVLVDWGRAAPVRSTMIYAVWGDFSPEDALVAERSVDLRANRAIAAPTAAEAQIAEALRQWKSQGEIIQDLVATRRARRVGERTIEVYIAFDPRPALDYGPYRQRITEIDGAT
jgi:LmbE family N-acetylglucosaminyl deacetylase